LISRFLRLFSVFRILETEYTHAREDNKRLHRRIRSLHSERDTVGLLNTELKTLHSQAETRIEQLMRELGDSRMSEIVATRQVADFQAFLRFGRGIYNRPESEVPIQEPITRQPIEKNRQQASDIAEKMRQKYVDDVKAFHVKQKETAQFFDQELTQ
jgi:hypothetical protein